jgi:stage V sporulation protein R
MELISQHAKEIMEGCKERARAVGLRFHNETLEYIVTNKDLLELTPKHMIPTLYDYWVHDVEVLKEKGRYELYPNNPYETVINTRPAISFYNDNNPDWLNVMIFYHVLAHIDFFQNNRLFQKTWDGDFAGQALSDKRFMTMMRSEKGRWVDYVIEFTRSIDNLVGFHGELSDACRVDTGGCSPRLDFYFDVFLQAIRKVSQHQYMKEIERYNATVKNGSEMADSVFLAEVTGKNPEFDVLYLRHRHQPKPPTRDLIQFLQEHAPFLQKSENRWMKSVMEIVRRTSLFFQPQIRTKIMNEGWASYWHERLFLEDDRIRGHEVDFAKINAFVTALPRVGLNPYALGMRLFDHIEDLADKGKRSFEFQKVRREQDRERFDRGTGNGRDAIFRVREELDDFMFLQTYLDQDFVNRHKLFVLGKRLNSTRGVWEYTIKSRNAAEYRQMLLKSLYHPPFIEVDESRSADGCLYLDHHFEGKPLVKELISNTLMGISCLWGGTVKLETHERAPRSMREWMPHAAQPPVVSHAAQPQFKRVLYTMEDRKLSKSDL